jgi:hypothetical protein
MTVDTNRKLVRRLDVFPEDSDKMALTQHKHVFQTLPPYRCKDQDLNGANSAVASLGPNRHEGVSDDRFAWIAHIMASCSAGLEDGAQVHTPPDTT